MGQASEQAAAFLGPGSGALDIQLTGAAATAATAITNAAVGRWLTIVCGVASNIRLGASTVAAPTDTASFPAGMYSFQLTKSQTHFRVMPNASGYLTWWVSSPA